MAEETESRRVDRSKRELEQRQRVNWGGKRFVVPHGTTLPSTGEAGEIFIRDTNPPVMVTWNDTTDSWSTVGPA